MRFDWTVTVAGVDISSRVIAGGTIDYGRRTNATGFQAPVAVFDLLTKDENPRPQPVWTDIHLGDEVLIHVTRTGSTQIRRFTGKVQALDYSLYSLRITATGTGVAWAGAWSGFTLPTGMPLPIDTTVPVETETARVQRWVGQAGQTVTIEGVPARWLRAVPQNYIGQPLLDLILRIADDCDGLLIEDRLGVMHYRTWNFTRPATELLPAHVVESETLDMTIERGALVNAVTVYYGEPDPATGVQASVYGTDAQSISEHGPHRAELYTDIQYAAGAAGKAQKYLERNRLEWTIPDVTLVMNQATGPEADAILTLQENWRVALSPLPDGCPIDTYAGDILGFTDIMHETDYRIILHLAGPVGDAASPPEEPIFPADSLTGGTTYTVEDQYAFLWQVHEFDTPGAALLECVNPVTVDALVCGAGGGGGSSSLSYQGGGGGAGAVFYGALSYTPGTIAVDVGAKGGAETNGGTTKLGDVWCYGGGRGGHGNPNGGGPGGDGGYGGGGGGQTSAAGNGLYGSLDGGVTTDDTRIFGGDGQASVAVPGNGGGWGVYVDITGPLVAYSQAGPKGNTGTGGATPATNPGSGGPGGNFNGAGAAGADGAVILRYRIG